jgi:hypothetical protein
MIVGLNVYRSSMEKLMYDFNVFEEKFCGNDHDSEQEGGEGMSRLSRIECEFSCAQCRGARAAPARCAFSCII